MQRSPEAEARLFLNLQFEIFDSVPTSLASKADNATRLFDSRFNTSPQRLFPFQLRQYGEDVSFLGSGIWNLRLGARLASQADDAKNRFDSLLKS